MEEEFLCDDIKEEFITIEKYCIDGEDSMDSDKSDKGNQASIKNWSDFFWKCYYCDYSFNEYMNFKVHLTSVHDAIDMEDIYYNCNDCKKPQSSYAAFLNHVRSVHHENLKLCCDICSENFLNFGQLSAHRYAHMQTSDYYPSIYHCNLCEIVHSTEKDLKKHIQHSHDMTSKENANQDNQPASTENSGSKRTTTRPQFTLMVNKMKNSPDIAKNVTKQNPDIVLEFWQSLTRELNALGPPCRRYYEWRKVWSDYKSAIKRKLAYNNREQQRAGGSSNSLRFLSTLEEEVAVLTCLKNSDEVVSDSACLGVPTKRPYNTIEDLAEKKSEKDDNVKKIRIKEALIVEEEKHDKQRNPKAFKLLEKQVTLQEEHFKNIAASLSAQEKHYKENKLCLESIHRSLENVNNASKKMTEIFQSFLDEKKRHNLCMEKIAKEENDLQRKILEIKLKKLKK